jgi:hypothetical protein
VDANGAFFNEATNCEGSVPANLRAAHERNDEVLERVYIGRRFKNGTERLEKLFELYTKMTAAADKPKPAAKATRWNIKS